MGAGLFLSLTHEPLRQFRGHIQIHHQRGLWQPQPAVFQVKEPVHKGLLLLRGQLGGLMDRVGGGVAVGQNQLSRLIVLPPVLPVGGKAVHREEHRGGVGVHVSRLLAQGALQIQFGRFGKGIAIAGKIDDAKIHALPGQTLAQQLDLGGFPGAVGTLEYDQFSLHFRFLFSAFTWTRNKGSFIIRPMRLGL